ncbi:MAG: UbiA family prenyltransferase [Chloroflexota bacterium]
MQRAWAFLSLVRLEYSLFSGTGVVVAGVLAGDLTGLHVEYVVAFAVIVLAACGTFAVNDYYDFEADVLNRRRDRPLVRGAVSRRTALVAGIVLMGAAAGLALVLNAIAASVVLASLPVFFLYSSHLKRRPWLKNVVVAYAYPAAIVLGSLVMDSAIEPIIIYFGVMGFIVGFAYEVMIDIADATGDTRVGIPTIATRCGARYAATLAAILYGVIIVMDPLPFFLPIDPRLYLDYVFLALIAVPVISYVFVNRSLRRDDSVANVVCLKKLVLGIMQVGCLAYLVGVLV